MARRRRTKAERQSDMVMIHRWRLQGLPPAKILERLNKRIIARAKEQLAEQGIPTGQAKAMALEFGVTPRTMRNDFAKVIDNLREGVAAGGEALVLQRLEELELERQALLQVEAEAWAQHEKGDQEGTVRTTQLAPVILDEDTSQEKKVLRPQAVTEKTTQTPLRSSWLERVIQCVRQRVDIGREMFELAASLSRPIRLPVDFSELAEAREGAEAVLAREVEYLYRAEARAAGGASVDRERLRLVQGMVKEERQTAHRQAAVEDAQPGRQVEGDVDDEPFVFQVRVISGGAEG